MPNNFFRGDSVAVAQVRTFALTNTVNGGNVTVVMNTKSITTTANSTSNSTFALLIASTLQAAADAAASSGSYGEFADVVWTASGNSVVGTASTPGRPFLFTASAGNSATIGSVSNTTSSAGPNHWDDPKNWSLGTVPASGDTVYIEGTSIDISYGLAQSGVTLAALNISSTYTGKIGLPVQQGTYYEYRDTSLAIGASNVTIGAGTGSGSSMLRIALGSTLGNVAILGTGSPVGQGVPSLYLTGSNANNTLTMTRGFLGLAFDSATTATFKTVQIGGQANVRTDSNILAGTGASLGNVTMQGGQVSLRGGATSLVVDDGTVTVTGNASNFTTLILNGGLLNYDAVGTVSSAIVRSGATINCERDPRPGKVFSSLVIYGGGSFYDGSRLTTLTTGIQTPDGVDKINVRLGKGITLQRDLDQLIPPVPTMSMDTDFTGAPQIHADTHVNADYVIGIIYNDSGGSPGSIYGEAVLTANNSWTWTSGVAEPGGTWWFKGRAVNDYGTSAWSEIQMFSF